MIQRCKYYESVCNEKNVYWKEKLLEYKSVNKNSILFIKLFE